MSISQYNKDGVLTTSLVMDAIAANYNPPKNDGARDSLMRVKASCDRLRTRMKEFEQVVWFGGLQDIVNATTERGFSMSVATFSMMAYVIAGRCAITLTLGNETITFVTSDTGSERVMGLQGFGCTEAGGLAMIDAAMGVWLSGKRPEVDRAVSLGF